ncbi:coagulation factor XIII B chain-like [Aquarana catesbeiana]|uniref:coagulation factor XIII B chain-like n=1 Tax=Aquarana catesbeiana TaxID=8400 RepID=UPI003CC9A006
MANMEYKTNENVFDVGAYFIYKCKEGFISSDNKVESISQCGNDGWQPKPECKEIFCTLREKRFWGIEETQVPFDKVVHFKCPENWTLEGSSSIQCFHFGWSSNPPICRDKTNEESLPSLDLTELKESKCPSVSALPNARVINATIEYFNGDEIEIECNPGYQLYGSEKGLCNDGKWQSLPRCIKKKKCTNNPPQIANGEVSAQSVAQEYYSGSTVKYICEDGYHIFGSDESKCIDGKWLPLPTCEDSSCGRPPKITNGVLKEEQKKATYLSGERATYECSKGYTMGQNTKYITCENSVWTELPVCREIGQTCGAPPVVQFGDITEIKQKTYQSGSSVIYKCANYYMLEGKQVITCRDGEWEKEPVCRGTKLSIAKAWKLPKVSIQTAKQKISWIMSQEKLVSSLIGHLPLVQDLGTWANYVGIHKSLSFSQS